MAVVGNRFGLLTGQARILNAENARPAVVATGPHFNVTDADFSPDGRRLVTASADGRSGCGTSARAGDPEAERRPTCHHRSAGFGGPTIDRRLDGSDDPDLGRRSVAGISRGASDHPPQVRFFVCGLSVRQLLRVSPPDFLRATPHQWRISKWSRSGGLQARENAMSERSIFIAALEKDDATERAAYLDQACAGDELLRARIERLLKAHEPADSFLERGPAVLDATDNFEPIAERPGTVIGPYKLIEPIGEGGMGSVWMAQQTEPVKRLVAVKLIKAGMDSRQVIARFEAERQALALMDHPNIARVLDARHHQRWPAVLRHGSRQGRAHHPLLRRAPPHAAAAAGTVHPGLPGGPARRIRRASSTAT